MVREKRLATLKRPGNLAERVSKAALEAAESGSLLAVAPFDFITIMQVRLRNMRLILGNPEVFLSVRTGTNVFCKANAWCEGMELRSVPSVPF